jgi:hypothetical protein
MTSVVERKQHKDPPSVSMLLSYIQLNNIWLHHSSPITFSAPELIKPRAYYNQARSVLFKHKLPVLRLREELIAELCALEDDTLKMIGLRIVAAIIYKVVQKHIESTNQGEGLRCRGRFGNRQSRTLVGIWVQEKGREPTPF